MIFALHFAITVVVLVAVFVACVHLYTPKPEPIQRPLPPRVQPARDRSKERPAEAKEYFPVPTFSSWSILDEKELLKLTTHPDPRTSSSTVKEVNRRLQVRDENRRAVVALAEQNRKKLLL